jgi:glucosylglycerate phosphorylase
VTTDAPQASLRLDPAVRERLRAHLRRLYPSEAAERTYDELCALLDRHWPAIDRWERKEGDFDETDVVLITYADQIHQTGETPLATLRRFLVERVKGVITGVHLLPFYPSTSDDGFAVADFTAVDPSVGDWGDVEAFASDFRLMLDAVFNHASASNPWFRGWLEGDGAYQRFFITAAPGSDLSGVIRPRPSPLLTPVEGPDGVRHVWTTFSPDQVDLDYRNPEVLLAVTGALLTYLARGAGIVRLDAVAFLWKRMGTSCIHLEETHEIIRFWRSLVEAIAPGVLLITETNVPHQENISYFGDGYDEAHLVYQFPLAPLVLSAFHLADASPLQEWAAGLSTPSSRTSFFNFLGSHDGVGLRPAEGLLTSAEIQQLCDLASAHGGGVSWKTNPDGSLSPYELNTVYFDALTEVSSSEPMTRQVDRFLAAQSILLALAGVPGIYVQALLGSRNWHEGVKLTGRLRSINRQKFELSALERELDDPASLRHQAFTRLLERIHLRTSERAFHPNGAQRIVTSPPTLFALERTRVDGSATLLCVHNLSGRAQVLRAGPEDGLTVRGLLDDLCAPGDRFEVGDDGRVELPIPPYGVRWLRSAG